MSVILNERFCFMKSRCFFSCMTTELRIWLKSSLFPIERARVWSEKLCMEDVLLTQVKGVKLGGVGRMVSTYKRHCDMRGKLFTCIYIFFFSCRQIPTYVNLFQKQSVALVICLVMSNLKVEWALQNPLGSDGNNQSVLGPGDVLFIQKA